MSSLKKFLIVFLLSICFLIQDSQTKYTSMEQACGKFLETFVSEHDNQSYQWNVIQSFDDSITLLSNDKFGYVKQAKSPFCENKTFLQTYVSCIFKGVVAIKQTKYNDRLLQEINTLKYLSETKRFPTYYGCFYIDESKTAYIVLEKTSASFANLNFLDEFLSWPVKNRIAMYSQLFDLVLEFWEHGLIHNNIQPSNIVLDENLKKPYIIDYGTIQYPWEKPQKIGSPKYFSPTKWREESKFRDIDDAYSLAVSILQMEVNGILSHLFRFKDIQILVKNCNIEEKGYHDKCRKLLYKNGKELLETWNFGKTKLNIGKMNEEDINFTSLLLSLIEFDNHPFDLKTTCRIMKKIAKSAMIV